MKHTPKQCSKLPRARKTHPVDGWLRELFLTNCSETRRQLSALLRVAVPLLEGHRKRLPRLVGAAAKVAEGLQRMAAVYSDASIKRLVAGARSELDRLVVLCTRNRATRRLGQLRYEALALAAAGVAARITVARDAVGGA